MSSWWPEHTRRAAAPPTHAHRTHGDRQRSRPAHANPPPGPCLFRLARVDGSPLARIGRAGARRCPLLKPARRPLRSPTVSRRNQDGGRASADRGSADAHEPNPGPSGQGPPTPVERAATALGVHIVRVFDGGMFGAVLVEGRGGQPLVLKASEQVDLEDTWSTGAAVASTLRARGYPAARRYVEIGAGSGVVWSLQEVLPGRVPAQLTEDLAEQLVTFARAHDVDSGLHREWDAARSSSGPGMAPWARAASRRLRSRVGGHADGDRSRVAAADRRRPRRLPPAQLRRRRRPRAACSTGKSRARATGGSTWSTSRSGATCTRGRVTRALSRWSAEAVHLECEPLVVSFMATCQALRALSQVGTSRPRRLARRKSPDPGRLERTRSVRSAALAAS